MSTCRVFSCVFGRGCLLWPVCSLGKTLLAFDLLRFVLQGQIYLLFQVFPDFLLCNPVPIIEYPHNRYLFGCSRRSCRSSYNNSTSSSSALLVGALTWITVILNGSPWKWIEIILSFLWLHPYILLNFFPQPNFETDGLCLLCCMHSAILWPRCI